MHSLNQGMSEGGGWGGVGDSSQETASAAGECRRVTGRRARIYV